MPSQIAPQDVANLLRGFLDGTNKYAWDDFESVPLADPFLESLRQRAIPMGPPGADTAGIEALLNELKARHPTVR